MDNPGSCKVKHVFTVWVYNDEQYGGEADQNIFNTGHVKVKIGETKSDDHKKTHFGENV